MAHTRSQDLKARFNTLQFGLIETQQEVKQLSANVVAINTTMQSSMEEIKQDLTAHLNLSFRHSAPNCISLQIILPLPHLHILKVTIPLIPITSKTITFSVTYVFRRWM
jgi:hypothetical protein